MRYMLNVIDENLNLEFIQNQVEINGYNLDLEKLAATNKGIKKDNKIIFVWYA